MREVAHQTNMRIVLHAYTIHTDCLNALDTHDTCGWRLSPLPFVHYPGERRPRGCDFVLKLVNVSSIKSHLVDII